jgi:hypothetical protein
MQKASRTQMNLADIFLRERGLFMFPQDKGRFYHDGRFKTLLDVVNSYDARFNLGLTDQQKHDLRILEVTLISEALPKEKLQLHKNRPRSPASCGAARGRRWSCM